MGKKSGNGMFKRFLANKNTVSILGIILGFGVLVFGYTYRVNKAISPQKIPCAKVAINSTTEITEDMIDYVKVSQSFLNKNPDIITNAQNLIGKYITTGSSIPVNSLFYSSQVVSSEELPDAVFANIPDGYTVYNLDISSVKSGYMADLAIGDYVDLYIDAKDDNGRVMYGKYISHIQIMDIKDSSGKHQESFNSSSSVLLFAVRDDIYLLLRKASLLSNIKFVPVVRNSSYTAKEGDAEVSSEYITNFINSKTMLVQQD